MLGENQPRTKLSDSLLDAKFKMWIINSLLTGCVIFGTFQSSQAEMF